MAINSTTLNYAITSYATSFDIGSTTGVTTANATTGVGVTYLFVQNEMMQVVSVPSSGHVNVIRGVLGTLAVAHVKSSIVLAGLTSDFQKFAPQLSTFQTRFDRFFPVSAAVAAAANINAPGDLFHITGTTAINTITPPSDFVEGSITVIADGAFTWASSAVQFGIATSGAATVGTRCIFTYDANTQLWYPDQATQTTTAGAATPAAATLAAPSNLFHVTGTTAINIITPPTNFSGQSITIIANGVLTWTVSSTVANGIAQSGTVTSAGETVTFTFDPATALWYPSRVA